VDVNYQAGTSEPVRADAPIVVGPKEKGMHSLFSSLQQAALRGEPSRSRAW
jgi:hypothetical protein